MVCTTLVIQAPAPTIKVNSVGFTINNADPPSCTVEGVGEVLGLILNVTTDRAASCKVAVTYTGPSGSNTVYVPLQLNAGTYNYTVQYSNIHYQEGTYTVTNTSISDIYAM